MAMKTQHIAADWCRTPGHVLQGRTPSADSRRETRVCLSCPAPDCQPRHPLAPLDCPDLLQAVASLMGRADQARRCP